MSFDMNKLMQQAQQMQEQVTRMQAEAANETAQSSVGGGLVKVTANGAGEVLALEEFNDFPQGSLGAVMVSYQMDQTEESNGS